MNNQIYAVEASAGAGKTHALAKKYVSLLLNPYGIDVKDILAMTFTNKAASEMNERILEFIKRIGLDRFSNENERENVLEGIAGRDVKYKAVKVMDEIIRNYTFFQVRTIDSFIKTIINGCSFRLGLASGYDIRTDHEDYLSYGLDSVIEKTAGDKKLLKVFREFLKQYMVVENARKWFPREAILEKVSGMFDAMNYYKGEILKSGGDVKSIVSLGNKIIKLIEKLEKGLPDETHQSFRKSIRNFLEGRRGINKLFDLNALSNEEIPVRKSGTVDNKSKKSWGVIRKKMSCLAEMKAYSTFNCYVDVFREVYAEFSAISEKENMLFLSELNRKAGMLVSDEIVPELYYRFATKFRHYLIDEFQDTSEFQWNNVSPMVYDALASGGSLFYVGDRKQAIFRFRGGSPRLFDRVREQYEIYSPKKQNLSVNFRSRKEIVDFNNELFSRENLEKFVDACNQGEDEVERIDAEAREEVTGVFENAKQEYRKDKPGGYAVVEHILYEDAEDAEEKTRKTVIEKITDARKRFAFSDIAVLARTNEEVRTVTEWLLEEGIPVESERTLNVMENSVIKEICSLLLFLEKPSDDLSFASFLLGDVFKYVSAGTTRQDIEGLIISRNEKTFLYEEFSKKYPVLYEMSFAGLIKHAGMIPLYELAVRIIEKFRVTASFHDYQGYLMKFLQLIKENEKKSTSAGSFIERVSSGEQDNLFVHVAETDSVKVLTIHKAKGLEFPVVIVPSLKIEIKAGSGKGSPVAVEEDGGLKFAYLTKTVARFSEDLGRKLNEEYKKAFIDELNCAYVALTRAMDELYVYVPYKQFKSGGVSNKICYFFPEDTRRRGELSVFEKPASRETKNPLMKISPSAYGDWTEKLSGEFVNKQEILNRERRLRGRVIHYILSLIGNLVGCDVSRTVKTAIEKTEAEFPDVQEFSGYEDVVNRLVREEGLKKFFFVENGSVYTEKQVVDREGRTFTIDRLIVGTDSVWVIDYKTSEQEKDEQRKQVSGYVELTKGIYADKKAEGVLIYVEERKAEKV